MKPGHLFKKVVVLLLPLSVLAALVYFYLFHAGYYPLITNSISLDAKFLDYRAHRFSRIDVLSVGSSMNLNNLDSKSIVLPNGLTTYYNFGAWGLQISDTLYLVKYLADKVKPKCIIVSSSLPDFCQKDNISIPTYLELDLVKYCLPYFYSKTGLLAIANRSKENRQCKRNVDYYDNLNFDLSGAVPLNIPPGKISGKRWGEKLEFPNNNAGYQYDKLQELAAYLRDNHIVFIFAQAPIRKAFTDSSGASSAVQSHFDRCKSIVDGSGGHYLNVDNPQIFGDSLFVDQFHLSALGSAIYTERVSNKLNELFNGQDRQDGGRNVTTVFH